MDVRLFFFGGLVVMKPPLPIAAAATVGTEVSFRLDERVDDSIQKAIVRVMQWQL